MSPSAYILTHMCSRIIQQIVSDLFLVREPFKDVFNDFTQIIDGYCEVMVPILFRILNVLKRL